MTSKSMKGFNVITKTEGGKKRITLERVKFYGLDASARIRKKKSKRIKVQHPQLAGLFSPRGK